MVTNLALRIPQIIAWINVIIVCVFAIIAIGFIWSLHWGKKLGWGPSLAFTLLLIFSVLYYLSTRFQSFFIRKKSHEIEIRLIRVEKKVAELERKTKSLQISNVGGKNKEQ